MRKTERQRAREREILSAYLDGALHPRDHQDLVARLQHEPELQERLEQLRRIKLTVGYLPRLQAPRHYTLTPEMVTLQKRRKSPILQPLRLASALAAILLVVLLGAETLLSRMPLTRTPLDSAPMTKTVVMTDEVRPKPLIIWQQPAMGGAEAQFAGRGGDAAVMIDTAMMAESMPVGMEEPVEQDMPAGELTLAAAPEMMLDVAPEIMLEAESISSTGAGVDTLEIVENADLHLILGINLEQGGEIIHRSGDSIDLLATQPAWCPILRALQIALGTIALGSSLAWWLLSRRR